jgi:hypothetical protein
MSEKLCRQPCVKEFQIEKFYIHKNSTSIFSNQKFYIQKVPHQDFYIQKLHLKTAIQNFETVSFLWSKRFKCLECPAANSIWGGERALNSGSEISAGPEADGQLRERHPAPQ